MGKFYNKIEQSDRDFIQLQHIFFVATAPLSPTGRVNVSPKGLDCFKILSDNQVGYMDLISSGNETSAHTHENGRITFMFCSFNGAPNILRLYGKSFVVLKDTEDWNTYAPLFTIYPSTRQLIIANIDLVQKSCGFVVPLFEYQGERDIHFKWAEQKGAEGLNTYIQENNLKSIDGLPTDISLSKNQ